MLKRQIKLALLIVVGAMFIITAVGCPNTSQKPNLPKNKQQDNQQKKPQVAGGKEPKITLFISETGEKKELKIEEYLKGVVAAEMDTSWPAEALAAQAILARTFTMKKIQEGGVEKRGTDASTSVEEFQAYDVKRINSRVEQAVKQTRGEVVTYKGDYINGWFFADAGGVTSDSADEGLAFRKEPAPYIHSVKDPGFAITEKDNKAWTASFPLSEVRQAVKEKAGKDPGAVNTVKITKKGPSGRATVIKLGNTTVSGPALRLALGSTEMRSTLLDSITVQGNNLVVKGKGYGHGVGMSQWGARALAEEGKSPEEIVKYFFKDVQVQKVWE